MILNSCNVQVYQNTFVNSTACIGRDTRSAVGDHFGWHPSTGPGVEERFGHVFVNNLLTGDANFRRPLMLVWQPSVLCQKLDKSPLKQYDYNVYVRNPESGFNTLVYWSPAVNNDCQVEVESLDGLQKVFAGSSANSKVYESYHLTLFKSPELGNYQLIPGFPGLKAGSPLPVEIGKVLAKSGKLSPYVGAYPTNL